jgi:hypothetical protein
VCSSGKKKERLIKKIKSENEYFWVFGSSQREGVEVLEMF